MKAFWSYLKMELKRAVKRLPFLALGTAALVLLLSGGALLGKICCMEIRFPDALK